MVVPQRDRYKTIMAEFMSYRDGAQYAAAHTFSTEELLRITPSEICRWLSLRAYGDAAPTPDMKPLHARSSTLGFFKKAISSFMPRQRIPWDPVTLQGNPTRSEEVNKLVKDIMRCEVRREGVESQARRPIEFDEFINVLTLIRSGTEKVATKYLVGSVLTLQWHLIARIDDMMKLRFADFTPNLLWWGVLGFSTLKEKFPV